MFFQAEDGIRDLVRSRGLGDVYKRQALGRLRLLQLTTRELTVELSIHERHHVDPVDQELSLIHI